MTSTGILAFIRRTSVVEDRVAFVSEADGAEDIDSQKGPDASEDCQHSVGNSPQVVGMFTHRPMSICDLYLRQIADPMTPETRLTRCS